MNKKIITATEIDMDRTQADVLKFIKRYREIEESENWVFASWLDTMFAEREFDEDPMEEWVHQKNDFSKFYTDLCLLDRMKVLHSFFIIYDDDTDFMILERDDPEASLLIPPPFFAHFIRNLMKFFYISKSGVDTSDSIWLKRNYKAPNPNHGSKSSNGWGDYLLSMESKELRRFLEEFINDHCL